jgi:hypothetical protein
MEVSPSFPRMKAPDTGRLVVQLTTGNAQCYPLYYFIPSISRDERFLIYHRAEAGNLQLYRLDLATAESVRLTNATSPDTQWRPWCVSSGHGVLDHRSVLNVARNQVVYFDGPVVRSVDVETRTQETLFELPAERDAYGQNGCTPDGRWFVFIHVPRGAVWGQPCRGAQVVAYDFDTGQQRTLCDIDSAVFHVTPYDNTHFVVTHPAKGPGMLWLDAESGTCELLRDGVVHCPCSQSGIAYEVPAERRLGWIDPLSRRTWEFPMPAAFHYIHTGCDPTGRLLLYENSTDWDRFETHDMYALVRIDTQAGNHEWLRLTGSWPAFVGGQKAHFHPRVTPDRNWVLFTGGDPAHETCHLFLLDISDVNETVGLRSELQVAS